MGKLWAVIRREYLERVRSKAFIIGTIIGALVIASVVFTVGTVVFEIDPSVLPEWASSIATGTP